ncbi:MAG: hypothetical protein K2I48_09865 [Muribaculaceae bacterium]|nr:hypothetical protein [Muribaculaceae bacterium]
MKLSIQHNIPDSIAKDITISFAKLFAKADYAGLRNLLSNDVYIVIYNRECKHGINSVLDYFEDWQKRTGDMFECEVRWSAQFSQPELYFTSEKFKQAYILGIENSKIARILLTPRSFSSIGFSIDDVPYNIGFIETNAPKKTEPLFNHYFCPICGKNSEQLDWRTGFIFKNNHEWGKKTGMSVNASICPDCNIVCEVSVNRTEKFCLTMTRDQQEKANVKMTEEQRAEYVDNSMGNKRPLFKNIHKPQTNELSKFGQKFHALLNQIITDNTPELVFSMLDKLSLTCGNLKLHVATSDTHDIGDESYFYIGDDENRDYKIYKHLKAEPSIEAAWQIYLLRYASTVMPVFWHGGYNVRNYVFDEASLNDYMPLECYDMSGLSRANLLLPEITLTPDGRTANVFCTYWNDWKGLVRDHLQIAFLKNGKIKLTEIEPLCLFEYNCGICF